MEMKYIRKTIYFIILFLLFIMNYSLQLYCQNTDEISTQDLISPGPFEVSVSEQTLTDTIRSREIPLRVYIPDSQDLADEAWPLVVFSHGGGETGASMHYLAHHLASHGFLTACPTHRGSDREWVEQILGSGNQYLFGDIEYTFGPRPADIEFVLDWLMKKSRWQDNLDTAKIATLGHCMGATTAMAVAGLNVNMPDAPRKSFRDQRICAAVALGPQIGQNRDLGLHEESWSTVETPVLVVIGTDDFFWMQEVKDNPDLLRLPYDSLPGLRCFASLRSAEHNAFTDSDPYYPAGMRDPQHHEWIKALVLSFLKSQLNKNLRATAWWVKHQLASEQASDIIQEHEELLLDIESVLLTIQDNNRDIEFQARATLPAAHARYPVLVFSPYMRGTRDDYQPLAQYWAAHGCAVIIPDHEGTPFRDLMSAEDTLATWPSRPQDLIAILNALPDSDIAAWIDTERVGIGGHLFGAHATTLTAGGIMYLDEDTVTFRDERPDALLLMSPQGRGQGLTEESWKPIDIPMLVTTGTYDHSLRTGNNAEWRKEPYEFSDGPDVWLAWVEGLQSDYDGLGSSEPLENPGPIAGDLLRLTNAFWRAHLFPDPAAERLLVSSAWSSNEKIHLSYKKGGEEMPEQSAFERAAEYSDQHQGAAVLVMHKGEIIFERYNEGATADTAIHIQSGTKGFWGPVVAAMIADGLISSFDEKAVETLPEWNTHIYKRQITIRNLLQLNAGLAQDVINLQGHNRPTLAPDLYAHAVQVPVVDTPGEQFSYGPTCYYVLGEILKRKLAELAVTQGNPEAETPLDYLKRRLFTPLGILPGKWVHDSSGNPHIPNGAWITALHWAGFGQFLLEEGRWDGEQLVPADLMQELRESSDPNPGHGLALWLNTPGGASYIGTQIHENSDPAGPGGFIYPDGESDLFAAMGGGKNRMYIVPSYSLVIVRQTFHSGDGFEDSQFLRLLFEGSNTTNVDPFFDSKPGVQVKLLQNIPNPFNPVTTISYTVNYSRHVRLTVYNLLGQKIKTLVNRRIESGTHTVLWDGTSAEGEQVVSGVYFYSLRTEDEFQTRKMLLIR